MRKLKLYLETSVWNFLFADDAPDKMAETIKLFDGIKRGKYEIFISESVEFEIRAAAHDKRKLLTEEIDRHGPESLDDNVESRRLVFAYIENGLLSKKHTADLSHIAIATVNGLDIVVSWNLRHLARATTVSKANEINRIMGYRGIDIMTPEEVNKK